MFKKILIANRGVIAKRVIDACHKLGISAVAVYTPDDQASLHVADADESYCVRKYNEPAEIISVAEHTKADAIHPGVGFLSENADFARIVSQYDCTFIGPPANAIDIMGNKVQARKIAQNAQVPVTPGSDSPVISEKHALALAEKIGYPVIIKACAGGGGMGMKIAHSQHEMIAAYRQLPNIAKELFGDPSVFIERYIKENRHIEAQILGDVYGNVIHLGERDCTVQRRHQKLIEFSPSEIPIAERHGLLANAVRLAKRIGYSTAGTIEFLYDSDANCFFMEMNTRIQVEHRVTELLTGIDLVAEQIHLAAREKLMHRQSDIRYSGFALECRINAEDPDNNFEATPGTITKYIPPDTKGSKDVIIDTFIPRIENQAGYILPLSYDSLLANIIVHGKTKKDAVSQMKKVLSEFVIESDKIKTTIPYHLSYLDRL